jgi:uncharacterized protein
MKLFLDTAFVQALLNKNDNFHEIAKTLLPQFKNTTEVWTTEAILTEIANALSVTHRASCRRQIHSTMLCDTQYIFSGRVTQWLALSLKDLWLGTY